MAAEVLPSVLDSFPPVQHAFAYGSGVFKQPGLYEAPAAAEEVAAAGGGGGGGAAARAADQPMLDFIFAVDDPVAWHEEVRVHVLQVASPAPPVALASLPLALRSPGSNWRLSTHPPPTSPNNLTPPLGSCRTCGATPTTTPCWAAWDPPR